MNSSVADKLAAASAEPESELAAEDAPETDPALMPPPAKAPKPAEETEPAIKLEPAELKKVPAKPAAKKATKPAAKKVTKKATPKPAAKKATKKATPKPAAKATPDKLTAALYSALQTAFDSYNVELFGGRLPEALMTLRQHGKARGYFAPNRFSGLNGTEGTVHELALNPENFHGRTVEEVLSTLVHEMTHIEQEEEGKPGRQGYHNKEWAALMRRVGLIPSDTGAEGGKETGQKVSHYIEPGGRFEEVTAQLIESGFKLEWGELPRPMAKGTNNTRVKYECPNADDCLGEAVDKHDQALRVQKATTIWASPVTRTMCSPCMVVLVPSTEAGEAIDPDIEKPARARFKKMAETELRKHIAKVMPLAHLGQGLRKGDLVTIAVELHATSEGQKLYA